MFIRIIIILLAYSLSFSVYAIIDLANVNVIPQNGSTRFCLSLDSNDFDKLYMAGSLNNQSLFFISPSTTPNQPSITPFGSIVNPPPLQQLKGAELPQEICFGPYANESLDQLKLFAGVGNSLADITTRKSYIQFFDGQPLTLPATLKPWTIMVYMVGSNLESGYGRYASADLLEMIRGYQKHSNVPANVVVTTGGANRDGWRSTKRSVIDHNGKKVISDLGDQAMATPQALSDFVLWTQQQFPAEHYALILWNHGDGTGGYGIDDSRPGNSRLTLPQLKQTYQTIRAKRDIPLDIVVYDACLMGSIEVAEVTSSLATVMAASADLEPGHGLNYEHLLTNLDNSIQDGITFGKLVKTGYLQQAKDQKTDKRSTITYSVYDLTQLQAFTQTLKKFGQEFTTILQKPSFLNYSQLSAGIIRAPGYPQKTSTGKLRSLDTDKIRLDLYNLLQTVSPEFPAFKNYAQTLLQQLDALVVSYDSNITNTVSTGKISLNIGSQNDYLSALPEAYSLLRQGLDYYNQRRKNDSYTPDSSLVCPQGLICADAKWLDLPANDILSVIGYYGQQQGTRSTIHLIKPLYQQQTLTHSLELPADGKLACRYELCTGDQCAAATLTDAGTQRIAEVKLNQSAALLTFCQTETNAWEACSVVAQNNGVWARETQVFPQDKIQPSLLTLENGRLQIQSTQTLSVTRSQPVQLIEHCDTQQGAIWAGYASANIQEKIEPICNNGDCLCKSSDFETGAGKGDDACKRLGVKAGVFLRVE